MHVKVIFCLFYNLLHSAIPQKGKESNRMKVVEERTRPTQNLPYTRGGNIVHYGKSRAGPVVLAGGAAALGPHMAGAPESCMYGGGEKPLGSAVSSGNGIAGAREPACSIPHDGHVHAELLMGRA